MATTEDPEIAERIRIMSLHGISKDAWKRFSKDGSWYYEIIAPGFKYNMTDMAAALGVNQLRKADFFHAERRRVAAKYAEGLSGIDGLILPKEKEGIVHSWHLYVVRVLSEKFGITRNEFIDRLAAEGIGTGVHYIPLHMHSYYIEKFGFVQNDFPVAGKLADEIVSLPVYPTLDNSSIARICSAIRRISSSA